MNSTEGTSLSNLGVIPEQHKPIHFVSLQSAVQDGHKDIRRRNYLGSFVNYVDRILPIIDHPKLTLVKEFLYCNM